MCVGKVEDGQVDYFKHFENDLLTITKNKYSECAKCIAYRFCKGGCPIWHLRGRDNKDGPVECQATKEYWVHVLKTVIHRKEYLGWYLEAIDIPKITNKVYKLKKYKKL